MLSLGDVTKKLERVVLDNSSTILTAVGVTGTLTTAYLTGLASFRAAKIINERESEDGYAVDPKIRLRHRFQLVWKEYIPPAATAVVTVSAIVCANRIDQRRAAALAAAYTVTEKALADYRKKVIEKVGEKKEQTFRDEIAQERTDKNPITEKTVILGEGRVLCYEEFTGRHFYSDMETLRKAQNNINSQVINDFYAPLSDFYAEVGLPQTSESSEVGWNADRLLELTFSSTLSEGKPCLSVGFRAVPIRNFYRLQ